MLFSVSHGWISELWLLQGLSSERAQKSLCQCWETSVTQCETIITLHMKAQALAISRGCDQRCHLKGLCILLETTCNQ